MSTSAQLSASLLLAQQILTRYGYPLILIFGDVGNILNILLFLKKTLRNTSCNIYFLVSAFTNLVALNEGIISLLYVYDRPSATTIIYCKTRNYVLNTSQQMSRFLIVAACFDRLALCSTSARLRQICQVHIACRYIIPCIIFSWLLIPLHIPIFYTISANTCVFPSSITLYNSIYGIIMAGLLPPSLMLIFSLLIFHNLKMRQRRRQIHPTPINTSTVIQVRRQQIKDQQALAMLLIQVLIYVVSTTLYTSNLLYTAVTMNDAANKTSERKSIESFASFLAGILVYVCPCLSFYSFTLASRLFRKELKLIVIHAYQRWWCRSWMMKNNRNGTIANTSLTQKITTHFVTIQRQITVPRLPDMTN